MVVVEFVDNGFVENLDNLMTFSIQGIFTIFIINKLVMTKYQNFVEFMELIEFMEVIVGLSILWWQMIDMEIS